MFNKNEQWLYVPIIIIVLIVLLHNINKKDIKGKKKELNKILNIRQKDRTIKKRTRN